MGSKMWSPGVALPVFLLLLLSAASVNSGPVIHGDGLLLREPEFDMWSAPAALSGYRRLRNLVGPSPPDDGEYHCPESGLFAKNDSCSDYYQCEDKAGILTASQTTCEPGMVFDDNLDLCGLASQVTTRPECTPEGTIPDDVRTNEDNSSFVGIGKYQCNGQSVTKMAEGTDEICMHVDYVEDYVTLVMKMIPLREYHSDNDKIAKILLDYDRDLEEAQDHAAVWREGDSILIGIGQTIKLAKDFEPEFNRKYERNKERVETIKANLHEEQLISGTKEAIATLETRLSDIKEALKHVPKKFSGGMEKIKNDIENDLAEQRRKLREDFTLTQELEEIVAFMEFVRNDASKIKDAADETRTRIDVLKNHLDKDKTAFLRHRNVSKLTLKRHTEETIRKNKELEAIAKEKEEKEREIEEGRKAVKDLRKEIDAMNEKAYNKRREIMSRGPSTKQIFGYIFIAIPFVGGALLASASADEKAELQKLDEDVHYNKQLIESKKEDIEDRNDEIKRFQDTIIDGSQNSEKLKSEMHDYTILNKDLEVMGSQLDQLIPAIDKAIYGIDGIKCLFDEVIGKLDKLISLAKEAKTESEKQNAKFFTYYEIAVLKQSWQGAYDLLLNLDECTGLLI